MNCTVAMSAMKNCLALAGAVLVLPIVAALIQKLLGRALGSRKLVATATIVIAFVAGSAAFLLSFSYVAVLIAITRRYGVLEAIDSGIDGQVWQEGAYGAALIPLALLCLALALIRSSSGHPILRIVRRLLMLSLVCLLLVTELLMSASARHSSASGISAAP